jgi:hypothetical protein
MLNMIHNDRPTSSTITIAAKTNAITLLRCAGTVQVQEVHQVNQHLDDCEREDDQQGDRLRQRRVHHQTEWNDGQDHRQDETDGVRL